MNRLLTAGILGVALALSTTSHASIGNVSNVGTFESPTSVGAQQLKIQMTGMFEQQLQRYLEPAELEALSSFVETSTSLGKSLNTQIASTEQDSTVTTVMLCFGVKGAIAIRVGGAVCVSTSREVHYFSTTGYGASGGFAGTGTVLVHRGPPQSLKGTYGGFILGMAAAQLVPALARGIFATVGGELAAMAHMENDSLLFLGGVAVGPMIDFGVTIINIH